MQTSKRLLALLLTLCLLLVCLPAGALAEEAKAEIDWQQLYLGKDLDMHYYASIPEAHKATASVSISVDGELAETYTVSQLEPVDGHYDLSVSLAPAQITDSIALTITSGEETLLSKQYTMLDYLKTILSGNYSDDTKALVKQLLNYGAQAQVYFDHHADALANAGYEIDPSALPTEAPATTVSGSVSGVHFYGASLLFESEIGLRLYFTAPDGIEGLTFETADQVFTPAEKNGLYYVQTYFYPQNISSSLALKVSSGSGDDAESMTVTYSPLSYILRMYNKSTNESLRKLLLAANSYCASAESYATQIRTGSLNFELRGGEAGYIQVNTNLPATTPCENFLTGENGSSIDESANQYHQASWIAMAEVDGTIVLTFTFDNISFNAGETYVLPKGAVFGFKDGSKYTLDNDYTFTFDGSAWSMSTPGSEAPENPLTFAYHWGNANTLQVKTNLPESTPLKDFLATDNGCDIDQSGNQYKQFSYASMANVDGTIVLTFNFSSAFEAGQTYVLPKGAVFGFTDGNKYTLDNDYTFTFNGGESWSMSTPGSETPDTPVEPENPLTFAYHWGNANTLQVKTNLPESTPLKDFLATDNGCDIDQSGNLYQQFGYVAMSNDSGTIVLTFNFSNAFEAGQTYVLPKGAVFGFTDGNKYTLDKDYTFTFDGASWSMETHETAIALSYRYGTAGLIQFNTDLTDSVPLEELTSGNNGCAFIQSGDQIVDKVTMIKAEDGKIVLTFNFNSEFTFGQSYTLSAGTIFGFTDGSKYELRESITLYWNGETGNWTTSVPTPSDKLDASYYTKGDIITFADRPVDSRDTEAIEKYKALGFNTSLLTEDFATADSYKIIVTTERPEDSLGFAYRYGTTTYLQVNTTLPSDTLCGTIYPDTEGSAIVQSGNHPFSKINVDNADGTIVLSFIFNTAFSAGETYSLASGSTFILPDGSKYELDANYTFTSDGSGWSMESDILTFDLVWVTAAHIIQLKTNIPSDKSYGDFLMQDVEEKGHKILLEQSEGSEVVNWFAFAPLKDNNGVITSDTLYFNLNFGKDNEHGAVYTLKAGTTLNAGDKKYVTVQDYTFTITKPYLTSLENLNEAGLDVWIRNYTNVDKYFSDELTATLLKYKNIIKGFYMADEVFETHALLEIAKEEDPDMQAAATDLESMSYLVEWFNTNFADTYFHVNHVPISSYDHYTSAGDTATENAESYQQFLETYREYFNEQLEGTAGSSISFDNYPFTHTQGKYTQNVFTGNYESTSLIGTFHSGIAEDYLLNALIAANVAGNDYDLGICIQAFEATDLTLTGNKRDITTAEEISFQIYSGLAFGADLFEYFAYTSSESMGVNGIMNEDGTERIYQQVMDGNKALSFAEVSNSFDWDGIITVAGTKENYNETAFSMVKDMVLTDTGALSTASATYDAIIGCFSHENGQNGYMVVNYNDPVAVTKSNSITVNFGECTRARVYTLEGGELTSEIVELTNGSYTATVAPGSGFFIIPA